MTKKIISSLLIAASIVSVSPVAASAEWIKDTNNRDFYVENGVNAIGWKYISGNWYHFDSNGAMQTGWFQDNGNWYYMWSNGAMAHDTWITNGGMWYYFESNGKMATDSEVVSNTKYDFSNPNIILTKTSNSSKLPEVTVTYATTTSSAVTVK